MKKVNRPVRPAKATLPLSCDAAPVAADELADEPPDVEVPFTESLPPVPEVVVGETLLLASEEAFLYAAKVFAPVVGGLIAPTIPAWQCLP